jgi:hypothetical protein
MPMRRIWPLSTIWEKDSGLALSSLDCDPGDSIIPNLAEVKSYLGKKHRVPKSSPGLPKFYSERPRRG